MMIRILRALWPAVLLALMTFITVSAKGGFAFITITGSRLQGEIRTSEPELTTDFFAFADFYRDKVDAPAEPGEGYTITRAYLDGKREIPFDRLHYYPETGFVFYDGILNGESEYDGDWYAADPGIRSIFESVLPAVSMKTVQSDRQIVPERRAAFIDPSQIAIPIAILSGLILALGFAFRHRKQSAQ